MLVIPVTIIGLSVKITKELSIQLLRGMKRIRLVEEGILNATQKGKMRCPVHLSMAKKLLLLVWAA